jgi:zinc protease
VKRFVLLVLVLAACAPPPPATAPVPAPTVATSAVPRIDFERYTLPNGLTVILHEDHSTPVVAVNVWYHVGSGDETPGRTGFAHLFEHIMFMGSQNVPVGQFDVLLESAGASNNGSTTNDRTDYYQTMPSNALPLSLWLEADRMGFLLPTMDEEKLDLQREVVKNERRQRVDNVPYGRASEMLQAALFPADHPYSWPIIGSMTDLDAATLDDVTSFFRTYYAPNNATVTIAGAFDPDSARAWVARYFSDIPRGPAITRRASVPQATLQRDTFLVLEDRVQLPRLYYRWHTVRAFHPDDAALDVLAAVLTSGSNSRLYQKLVYELQVAQSVGASQSSGRLDGWFTINVLPRPGNAPAEMARLTNAEIERVAREGITQRELERAQNSLRSSFLNGLASVLGKSDQLNFYNYFVGTPDYVQQDAARYDAVTLDDVRRVAAEYLGRPRVVLTVVPEGNRELMVTAGTGEGR